MSNLKHISFATRYSQSIAKNAILGLKYVMVHKTTKHVGLSTNDFKQLRIKIRFKSLDFSLTCAIDEDDLLRKLSTLISSSLTYRGGSYARE